jgi:hypothetical protein
MTAMYCVVMLIKYRRDGCISFQLLLQLSLHDSVTGLVSNHSHCRSHQPSATAGLQPACLNLATND